MLDVQGLDDGRMVGLQRVGVKRVLLPAAVLQRDGGQQPVTAALSLGVDLPARSRGVHMSRLMEVLEDWRIVPLAHASLEALLRDTRQRLGTESAHVTAAFTYFLVKKAPVTRRAGTMGYTCRFSAALEAGERRFTVRVDVPTTTLCPCSKAISAAGAHNQRAWLRVAVRPRVGAAIWLDDLIPRLEAHGSCELYPLLKRFDEQYVTERAYANPKFVEDVLRDVVLDLRADPAVAWFDVACEADESIHAHNAYASQTETLPADPACAALTIAPAVTTAPTPVPVFAGTNTMEAHA
jgi:GTP cyclohydrolase I